MNIGSSSAAARSPARRAPSTERTAPLARRCGNCGSKETMAKRGIEGGRAWVRDSQVLLPHHFDLVTVLTDMKRDADPGIHGINALKTTVHTTFPPAFLSGTSVLFLAPPRTGRSSLSNPSTSTKREFGRRKATFGAKEICVSDCPRTIMG